MPSAGAPATRCGCCGALTTARDGVSVRVADVRHPPGTMGAHAHGVPHLVVVLAGGFSERAGTHVREAGRGTVLYRPAGEEHSETYDEPVTRYVSIALPRTYVPARFRGGAVPSLCVRGDEAMLALAARLAREIVSADAAATVVLDALALELAARALDPRPNARGSERWIATARAMIEADHASVTPGGIADALGLDASYVARTFRERLGRSVGDAIRAARIAAAARRLAAEPDVSLADVAVNAGFFDQSHFSRAFKRVAGMTPGAFRGAHRSNPSKTVALRDEILGAWDSATVAS